MKAREKRRRRKARKARQRARWRVAFQGAIDGFEALAVFDGAIYPKWLKAEPLDCGECDPDFSCYGDLTPCIRRPLREE